MVEREGCCTKKRGEVSRNQGGTQTGKALGKEPGRWSTEEASRSTPGNISIRKESKPPLLSHKHNALELQRRGKIDEEEEEEELELAKALEKQLEEFDNGERSLMNTLKAIGLEGAVVTISQLLKKPEPEANYDRNQKQQIWKADLEERI